MSDFASIAERPKTCRPASPPPNWLVAPHLRRSPRARIDPVARADAVETRRDQAPRQQPPVQAASPRRLPFPDWRDRDGVPLAALLGPPRWRNELDGR